MSKEKAKSHVYFVSFAHPNGFGNTHVELDKPINTKNLYTLNQMLADKKGLTNVVILFYTKTTGKLNAVKEDAL